MRSRLFQALEYAVMAPSFYNTQPWKLRLESHAIHLLPDFRRALPATDPGNRNLYISLGCVLENLLIALQEMEFNYKTFLFSHPMTEDGIRVEVTFGKKQSLGQADLVSAMSKRKVCIAKFDGRPIPQTYWRRLCRVPLENGVHFLAVSEKHQFPVWIDRVKRADEIFYRHPTRREELLSWARFTRHETARTHDGVPAEDMGLIPGIRWIGSLFVRNYNIGYHRARVDMEKLESSSGIVLLTSREENRLSWVAVGRSFQRLILTARSLEIFHAYMNHPLVIPSLRREIEDSSFVNGTIPQLMICLGFPQEQTYSNTLRRSLKYWVEEIPEKPPFEELKVS